MSTSFWGFFGGIGNAGLKPPHERAKLHELRIIIPASWEFQENNDPKINFVKARHLGRKPISLEFLKLFLLFWRHLCACESSLPRNLGSFKNWKSHTSTASSIAEPDICTLFVFRDRFWPGRLNHLVGLENGAQGWPGFV